ncbi:FeoB-associated Cys-rich membrane protein [Enterocloster sp.]
MNPWNLVTGLLVFASLVAALRKLWKDKKNGTGGCSGSCSGCSGCCGH